MTLRIFFSYDSDDNVLVRRLKDGIENRIEGNVDVYIYEEDPQPGELPSTKAMEGIKQSDAFLVLVTPNSQNSAWVQQEVGFAKGEDCEIIPIVLDHPETELTGLLDGAEYFPVDEEDPEAFLNEFRQYAEDRWEAQLRNGDGPDEPDKPDGAPPDVHPVLAGRPFVHHLTFTRLHALELGVYFGALAYIIVWSFSQSGEGVTVVMGNPERVLGVILVGVLRVAVSEWRVGRNGTAATHRLGLHDILHAPVSFVITGLFVLWASAPRLF